MNILHLTLSLEYGGRRKVILGLARATERRGDRCTLAVLGSERGPDAEFPIDVVCLGRRSMLDLKAVGRLQELCRRKRIDVIHTHDAASQLMAAMLRLRHPRTAPLALMTFHRSIDIESTTRRARLRNRLATAATGQVVAVSAERREHFIRQNCVNPRRVVSIPNGIETERLRPDPTIRAGARQELGMGDDEIVCGAVGHFGHEKGLDIVLRAFREMLQAKPSRKLRLVIAGSGKPHDEAALRDLAANCDNRVTFLGYQPDLARWFQAFDLMLHAPRSEAFGLVVVEAMASGVPVVAARVGGIPEVIVDGETGRLVDPESPAALATAAFALIDSPVLRSEWGERAQRVVAERFTTDVQADHYHRVYRTICERHGKHLPAATDKTAATSANEARQVRRVTPTGPHTLST